jgi:hypothetical protein
MSTSQQSLNQFFQNKKNIPTFDDKKIKSPSTKGKIGVFTAQADEEEFLKRFDFDPTFGPSSGLTRTERFENAKRFGLNPNENVMNLISKTGSDVSFLDR